MLCCRNSAPLGCGFFPGLLSYGTDARCPPELEGSLCPVGTDTTAVQILLLPVTLCLTCEWSSLLLSSQTRNFGSRGGPSNDARAGTPLLGGKAGRAGAAQPGEEKAAGRPQSSCQCLEGLRESWRGACDRTRGDGFRLKEGRFR